MIMILIYELIGGQNNYKKMIDDYKNIKMGRDLTIDVKTKTIIIRSNMYDVSFYTFIKNLWKESPYHIKYPFPIAHCQPLYFYDDWKVVGLSNLVHKQHIYEEQKNNNE